MEGVAGRATRTEYRLSVGKRRRISPEGKEKERARERKKDVGRHHERKKERTPRDGRKIEKDCHARHSGGDEGGGATWSSAKQARQRERERAGGENGDSTRVARRG